MKDIFNDLANLVIAVAKKDWAGAVTQAVELVKALIANFPAHKQADVKNALAKVVHEHNVVASAAPGVEDNGHFFD